MPDEFWTSFVRTHWDRVGAVIRQPLATPLASPAEVFSALVVASDRLRAGDARVQLEFCIDQARQVADIGRYLPSQSDGTAERYAERVTSLIGGRKFGLIAEDVQASDATLWLRLRDFLRGLYEHTGLPGDVAKATVFLGNYDRTPFGLHRGTSHNFVFAVDGPKRMRTWPDAYFRGKEDLTHRMDYAQHNGDSIVMDAQPGDVIYWPSDYWHIGESVGGALACSVSVALFMEPRPSFDVAASAANMVYRQLADGAPSPAIRPSALAASVGVIETTTRRAIDALKAVSDDERLLRALRVSALNRVTGSGFDYPPIALPLAPLADDATVRGDARYPVLWMRSADDEIICSANGHSFGIAASQMVLALLEWVNSGVPASVASLVAAHSGAVVADGVEFETSAEDVRGLLDRLVSLRALASSAIRT